MTELAYLGSMAAAYEREFDASVVALPPGAVVLDRTLFYPAGGGQPGDRGELVLADGGRLGIADVVKNGTLVVHRIARGPRPPLSVGDAVHGRVDWERRYGHMRLHTAQHLLSALVFQRTGAKTRHAVFGKGRGTIEAVGPWPAGETPETLGAAYDGFLEPSREVRIRFVPRQEWDANPSARSGLVPLSPLVDPVRVVEIDGIDTCPCGGTHLAATGEIGGIEFDGPFAQAGEATRIGFALRTAAAHSSRVTP